MPVIIRQRWISGLLYSGIPMSFSQFSVITSVVHPAPLCFRMFSATFKRSSGVFFVQNEHRASKSLNYERNPAALHNAFANITQEFLLGFLLIILKPISHWRSPSRPQLDRLANGNIPQRRPPLRSGKLTAEKKKPSETLTERFRELVVIQFQ